MGGGQTPPRPPPSTPLVGGLHPPLFNPFVRIFGEKNPFVRIFEKKIPFVRKKALFFRDFFDFLSIFDQFSFVFGFEKNSIRKTPPLFWIHSFGGGFLKKSNGWIFEPKTNDSLA